MTHPRHLLRIAAFAALPAVITALWLLWSGDHEPRVRWTLTVFVVLGLLIGGAALYERAVRPLQTVSNMLAALREGDYSLRARRADPDDDLGLLYLEANTLGEELRSRRLGALEASALLRTVMAEIDAAVLAFDDGHRLRLVNRAGERLLGQPSERLIGRDAAGLGLAHCLGGESPRVLEPPGGSGPRLELRRTTIRQAGRPLDLVVLTDVSRTLQAEERLAWRRLIRVLSHEINNSLAPIQSLAGSLRKVAGRPADADSAADLRQGLDIIGQRAESLGRFMAAYARLARLPRPVLAQLDVGEWVARVARLQVERPVRIDPGPSIRIQADGDQLDQVLINLIGNAADAVRETQGEITIRWRGSVGGVEVEVEDEGPGIADTANLFVPFYTTKPGGSGIGLALSRQIVEAHGGALRLENRPDRSGCLARLWLPSNTEATGRLGTRAQEA
jgi:nitrogen fixation/metabolism regulation signal transduction histidine kinase